MTLSNLPCEFEEFKKIPRLSRRCVITEKIDGTNAQVNIVPKPDIPSVVTYVAEVGNLLVCAGSRTRWITPEDDNFGFARWVRDHAEELIATLGEGRHYGEWWGSGIQRGYGLKGKRFSLFNTHRWADAPLMEGVSTVPVLYDGLFHSSHVEEALDALVHGGSVAAPGFMKPEGIIIYHVAANSMFKKTLDKDDEWKGKA